MADTSVETNETAESSKFSRRGFLRGAGMTAVVAAVAETGLAPKAEAQQTPPVDAAALNRPISGEIPITLDINNQARTANAEPRTTLLSYLRDRLEPPVTGPKLVCSAGTCGACSVVMNGRAVYGCSILAVDAVGKKITTVEGIGTPEKLSPVQAAFVEKDGMMCGMCTDGFVTAITVFLTKNPNPTLDQLKVGIKGNFCRCGTYPHIFEAALSAARVMRGANA